MEMSPYRRNMNDDPNMFQMYGYMPAFGPNEMPPSMPMFDGKNMYPRDYPLLRGLPEPYSANDALGEGRGYPMSMPFPPPEMYEPYPPSSRFRRGDPVSAGNIPGLQPSSNDGPASRGIPWEYGMQDYPPRNSSQNPMSWQGPPPGYYFGKQYPAPYGAPPGQDQGNEK